MRSGGVGFGKPAKGLLVQKDVCTHVEDGSSFTHLLLTHVWQAPQSLASVHAPWVHSPVSMPLMVTVSHISPAPVQSSAAVALVQ